MPPARAFSVYEGLPRLQNSAVVAGALSSYAAPPGARVTITGTGFVPEGNAVFLENEAGARYPARQAGRARGGVLTFVVPEAPRGIYRVKVENVRGRDEAGVIFAVADAGTTPPKSATGSGAVGSVLNGYPSSVHDWTPPLRTRTSSTPAQSMMKAQRKAAS